jgi:hypothetical protein
MWNGCSRNSVKVVDWIGLVRGQDYLCFLHIIEKTTMMVAQAAIFMLTAMRTSSRTVVLGVRKRLDQSSAVLVRQLTLHVSEACRLAGFLQALPCGLGSRSRGRRYSFVGDGAAGWLTD